MKTMAQINDALRQYGKKDTRLLFFCLLLSQLLMTAYAVMMWSPTVLTILPEGGDSRKQVMSIFVLTCLGCIIFVGYGAALFLKQRAKQTGLFMALGIQRKVLRKQILSELGYLGIKACLIGMVGGVIVGLGIWLGLRKLVIDTAEMQFTFSAKSLLVSLTFGIVTCMLLFIQGLHFQKQANVMDVLNAVRKNEPVHEVKRWYGLIGIVLCIGGFLLGYLMPSFFIFQMKWYPPEGLSLIFYSPLFVGLYMLVYYTVVHGWHTKKDHYVDIVPRSMMKFNGRQTVRNMLIILLLTGGGYFAAFYTPLLGTSALITIAEREDDFFFHYPQDQKAIAQLDIEALAETYDVTIKDHRTVPFANLAYDGEESIEEENGKYHKEYRDYLGEANFLSASSYEAFTGEKVEIAKGSYKGIILKDGNGEREIHKSITKLSNPETYFQLEMTYGGNVENNILACRYYVINDEDYEKLTGNLSEEWKENLVAFNVGKVEESYFFAKALYGEIIDRLDESCELPEYYDRVMHQEYVKRGEVYWADREDASSLHFEQYESSEFKMYWRYMPLFRVMDKQDLLANYAVFMMVFVFITIICFVSVLIIIYTRNMTLAINNKQVYEDLKRLGAGRDYLFATVKSQVSKVIVAPVVIGTVLIALLYVMILYMNDGGFFSKGEIAGLMSCMAVIGVISIGIYSFYHYNLRKVCSLLEIDT